MRKKENRTKGLTKAGYMGKLQVQAASYSEFLIESISFIEIG